MGAVRRFLIVEDDTDGEFLLRRSLLKTFPDAIVASFHDSSAAVAAATAECWDAHVVHRALDGEGVSVVAALRQQNATLPIVMVSSRDQPEQALAAGATHFVNYFDWQKLGAVLLEALAPAKRDAANP